MVWTQGYQLFVWRDCPGEKTVIGDWHFNYLSGSHLQSQVKNRYQMMVFMTLVLVLIGQFCHNVIGHQNVKVVVKQNQPTNKQTITATATNQSLQLSCFDDQSHHHNKYIKTLSQLWLFIVDWHGDSCGWTNVIKFNKFLVSNDLFVYF